MSQPEIQELPWNIEAETDVWEYMKHSGCLPSGSQRLLNTEDVNSGLLF